MQTKQLIGRIYHANGNRKDAKGHAYSDLFESESTRDKTQERIRELEHKYNGTFVSVKAIPHDASITHKNPGTPGLGAKKHVPLPPSHIPQQQKDSHATDSVHELAKTVVKHSHSMKADHHADGSSTIHVHGTKSMSHQYQAQKVVTKIHGSSAHSLGANHDGYHTSKNGKVLYKNITSAVPGASSTSIHVKSAKSGKEHKAANTMPQSVSGAEKDASFDPSKHIHAAAKKASSHSGVSAVKYKADGTAILTVNEKTDPDGKKHHYEAIDHVHHALHVHHDASKDTNKYHDESDGHTGTSHVKVLTQPTKDGHEIHIKHHS